jgi:hypothetical protein
MEGSAGRTCTGAGGRADRVSVDAGLEAITSEKEAIASARVGTLSFPVWNGVPIHRNTRRIQEIIRRRRPALLLCAGRSVPSAEDLQSISAVTKHAKTVVVLETDATKPINFRICSGKRFQMGEQFFHNSKTANDANLRRLDVALSARRFKLLDWRPLLLVCGEITVVCGRPPRVDFRLGVRENLMKAICGPRVMILNPTHTRMKRWEINKWRKYLSSKGHICVSASNWNLSAKSKSRRPAKRGPSPTLHTFWYNGRQQNPMCTFENEFLCYREWHLPKWKPR